MKIKTTRYNFTSIRMAKVKKAVTRAAEDAEKLDPSYPAGGNVRWCSLFGKQSSSSANS